MRRLPLLLLAILAAGLLAWLAAPVLALRAVQSAARDGDTHALAELIDYPAVRAGLRTAARPPSAQAPPDPWRDPIGAVRRALAPVPAAAPDPDLQLSPAGLAAAAGPPGPWPRVRHWGPNRIRFAVAGAQGETLLTFQRTGPFRWRLVQVRPAGSDFSPRRSRPRGGS